VALRHAILAALLDGEASGYELARTFEPSASYFWHCTPQQLYAELARLEEAGLTSGREVVQERRPNKRVFTITRAGRAELSRFVGTVSKPSFIRDDLLVKVLAARPGETESLVEQIERRAALARVRVAQFDEELRGMRRDRSEREYLAAGERIGPYLVCVRGRVFEQENLAWCTWAVRVLRAREKGGPIPRFPSTVDGDSASGPGGGSDGQGPVTDPGG
jgi:DNA-binding PadR family transcriptional regulator